MPGVNCRRAASLTDLMGGLRAFIVTLVDGAGPIIYFRDSRTGSRRICSRKGANRQKASRPLAFPAEVRSPDASGTARASPARGGVAVLIPGLRASATLCSSSHRSRRQGDHQADPQARWHGSTGQRVDPDACSQAATAGAGCGCGAQHRLLVVAGQGPAARELSPAMKAHQGRQQGLIVPG